MSRSDRTGGRWPNLVLALALVLGSVAAVTVTGPPVVTDRHLSYELVKAQALADPCKTVRNTSSTIMPTYMSWVESTQAHRAGHFWTSRTCSGLVAYWGRGQAHEGKACTWVRLIIYDANGRWDHPSEWRKACPNGIPIVFEVRPGTRLSFECQDVRVNQRRPHLWCLYNPFRY